ncbi:ADP-ribosyltransferase domain-containing protein [Spirosoma validum]|uniref:NAD(+)--protein-arginine ADP-ribosyltransferase n=1 Tax=Spirosoma validum TaxID=2771355 RepID=A0A927AYH8_9BACT|nr:ADP-ribosyltransferase domain-containing protein [Spirosoma validum]MBD2751997.1 hypothetical protein [Spirosoma validum]
MVFEEPLILHHCAQSNEYFHWIEHLNSFESFLSKKPPQYNLRADLQPLKKLISVGLEKIGYTEQAKKIGLCSTEIELNNKIIEQYTDETSLYYDVNKFLRDCHLYQDGNFNTDDTESFDNALAPWILQLNVAIRQKPTFEQKVYRGTNLSQEDIEKYTESELFVWAPFVSASKSKEECFGGNVLFEIFTESAMSLNDKRYPRDISLFSKFKEEEEVLFPVACAYRVHYVKKEDALTTIGVATVDYN